jgi:hypothetical protein
VVPELLEAQSPPPVNRELFDKFKEVSSLSVPGDLADCAVARKSGDLVFAYTNAGNIFFTIMKGGKIILTQKVAPAREKDVWQVQLTDNGDKIFLSSVLEDGPAREQHLLVFGKTGKQLFVSDEPQKNVLVSPNGKFCCLQEKYSGSKQMTVLDEKGKKIWAANPEPFSKGLFTYQFIGDDRLAVLKRSLIKDPAMDVDREEQTMFLVQLPDGKVLWEKKLDVAIELSGFTNNLDAAGEYLVLGGCSSHLNHKNRVENSSLRNIVYLFRLATGENAWQYIDLRGRLGNTLVRFINNGTQVLYASPNLLSVFNAKNGAAVFDTKKASRALGMERGNWLVKNIELVGGNLLISQTNPNAPVAERFNALTLNFIENYSLNDIRQKAKAVSLFDASVLQKKTVFIVEGGGGVVTVREILLAD